MSRRSSISLFHVSRWLVCSDFEWRRMLDPDGSSRPQSELRDHSLQLVVEYSSSEGLHIHTCPEGRAFLSSMSAAGWFALTSNGAACSILTAPPGLNLSCEIIPFSWWLNIPRQKVSIFTHVQKVEHFSLPCQPLAGLL